MATVWTTTATFRTTPPDSYQLQGFDPALPLPVAFLNWKLYDLDSLGPSAWRGYVTAASGGSSTALVLRGGSASAGDIIELKLDTDSWSVISYTGGTLESPTGGTGRVSWAVSTDIWSYSGQIHAGKGFTAAANTATTTRARYGYTAALELKHYLMDSAGGWSDPLLRDSAASWGSSGGAIAFGTGVSYQAGYGYNVTFTGSLAAAYAHGVFSVWARAVSGTFANAGSTSNAPADQEIVVQRDLTEILGGRNLETEAGSVGKIYITGLNVSFHSVPLTGDGGLSSGNHFVWYLRKQARSDGTITNLATLTLTHNGVSTSGTADWDFGSAASIAERVDLGNYRYYVEGVGHPPHGQAHEAWFFKDLYLTVTKYAVE